MRSVTFVFDSPDESVTNFCTDEDFGIDQAYLRTQFPGQSRGMTLQSRRLRRKEHPRFR